MDTNKLAELLFPNIDKEPEYYEDLYPVRRLEEGAKVTRIGPRPTGFVHLGNLYTAIIGERLAHQSGGTFYLRVEDTDAKREVPGAVELVLSAMAYFGITFDEGAAIDGDSGSYGPYRQRQRKEVYQCFAKALVRRGLAYPCFCTEERLEALHAEQRGKAEAKFLVLRLVVKYAHTERSAERAAERGEGEERALRDAPLACARLCLVDAHGGKGDDVDSGEVDEEIAHRRPPFAPDFPGLLPGLPPDFPEAAGFPALPGLADFPLFAFCALRAAAGFLPPP